MLTIIEGTHPGPIMTTIARKPLGGREFPDLVVMIVETIEVRRYRWADMKPVFSAERTS